MLSNDPFALTRRTTKKTANSDSIADVRLQNHRIQKRVRDKIDSLGKLTWWRMIGRDDFLVLDDDAGEGVCEMEETWVVLLHGSRAVRWLSIIDGVFCFWFVMAIGVFVLLVCWMPVVGYLGAKKFDHQAVAVYLTFIMIIIFMRLLVLALIPNPINVIAHTLGMAIEVYICRCAYTFYKLCVNLTLEERDTLEMTSNSISTWSTAR